MILNEENVSINGKEFGQVDAIKLMQAVTQTLVPIHKGMAS
jgi:hypothetical protein